MMRRQVDLLDLSARFVNGEVAMRKGLQVYVLLYRPDVVTGTCPYPDASPRFRPS
jgi:hypothetical protein